MTAQNFSFISCRQVSLLDRYSYRITASCAMEFTVVPPFIFPTLYVVTDVLGGLIRYRASMICAAIWIALSLPKS